MTSNECGHGIADRIDDTQGNLRGYKCTDCHQSFHFQPSPNAVFEFIEAVANEAVYLAGYNPIPPAFTVAREEWWATADTSRPPIGTRIYLHEEPTT